MAVTEILFPGVDPAVGAFIRGYCGWHVAPVVQETVTFDAADVLLLRSLRVVSVDSVTVAGQLWEPDQFEWSTEAGLLGRFGSLRRSVVVVFTHGFDTCPLDLQQVATRLSSAQVPAGATVRVGAVSVSGGPTDSAGLDAYSRGVLDRYKLPSRP